MALLDLIPEDLRGPLTLVVLAHLIALTFWIVFFVRDLMTPPVHPIVTESKKDQ